MGAMVDFDGALRVDLDVYARGETYSHLWPSAEGRTREAAASLMLESAGQYRATPGTASL